MEYQILSKRLVTVQTTDILYKILFELVTKNGITSVRWATKEYDRHGRRVWRPAYDSTRLPLDDPPVEELKDLPILIGVNSVGFSGRFDLELFNAATGRAVSPGHADLLRRAGLTTPELCAKRLAFSVLFGALPTDTELELTTFETFIDQQRARAPELIRLWERTCTEFFRG